MLELLNVAVGLVMLALVLLLGTAVLAGVQDS